MPSETLVQEARIHSTPMVNNLLSNPGFDIWQRGAGPFTSAGLTADEWYMAVNSGVTPNLVRSTDAKFGDYSLDMQVEGCSIGHTIESWRELMGKWITFSCWVKCPKENGCLLLLTGWNGTTEASDVVWNTGSPNWEQMVGTFQVPTNLTPSGIPGFFPHAFPLRVGVSFFAPGKLDGCVVAEGYHPEGLDYVPSNPAQDLENCQRFYQASDGGSTDYGGMLRYRQDVAAGSVYWGSMWFRTPMYALPTVSLTNVGASRFPTTPGTVQRDTKGFKEYRTASTTGASGYFVSNWTAEVT